MKLESLQKAIAKAREQAGDLETKSQQAGVAARVAKSEARQAKSKFKLAKRKAKQARKLAKDAKQAFIDASNAAEKAAAKITTLEGQIQRATSRGQQAHPAGGHLKSAPAPKSPSSKTAARSHAPIKAKPAIKAMGPAKATGPFGGKPAPQDDQVDSNPGGGPPQSGSSTLPSAETDRSPTTGDE